MEELVNDFLEEEPRFKLRTTGHQNLGSFHPLATSAWHHWQGVISLSLAPSSWARFSDLLLANRMGWKGQCYVWKKVTSCALSWIICSRGSQLPLITTEGHMTRNRQQRTARGGSHCGSPDRPQVTVVSASIVTTTWDHSAKCWVTCKHCVR